MAKAWLAVLVVAFMLWGLGGSAVTGEGPATRPERGPAPAATQSDADLAGRVVGEWEYPTSRGTCTHEHYWPNGRFAYDIYDAPSPGHVLSNGGEWSIDHGVLVVHFEWSDGMEERKRTILDITPTVLTLQFGDGKPFTLRRVEQAASQPDKAPASGPAR